MAYESKPDTGVLFSNKRKPAADAKGKGKPDCTGNILVGDVKCELAGWTKVSKKGDKYVSLTIKVPEGYKLVPVADSPAVGAGPAPSQSTPTPDNVAF